MHNTISIYTNLRSRFNDVITLCIEIESSRETREKNNIANCIKIKYNRLRLFIEELEKSWIIRLNNVNVSVIDNKHSRKRRRVLENQQTLNKTLSQYHKQNNWYEKWGCPKHFYWGYRATIYFKHSYHLVYFIQHEPTYTNTRSWHN